MYRRLLMVAGATGIAVLLSAGTASAQDCFVVNRSAQGSTQAGTHSSQWVAFSVTGDLLGLPAGQCATDINNALTAADLPTVFATRTDKVLLSNLPQAQSWLLANAKGIDHLDVSPIIPEVIGVVGSVLGSDPACA